MKLPSLPTDNLYKFIALFGLFLVITTIYSYSTIQNDLDEKWAKGAAVLEAQSDLLMAQLKIHDKPTEQQKGKISDLKKRKEKLEQTGTEVEDYWTAYRKAKRWKNSLLFLMAVGFLMIIIGFYLWYVKLQKYQDIILINQAKSRNESKSEAKE